MIFVRILKLVIKVIKYNGLSIIMSDVISQQLFRPLIIAYTYNDNKGISEILHSCIRYIRKYII